MKVLTVQEAIESMSAKVNEKGKVVYNRFSKKNFNTLMVALLNDPEFTVKAAKVKGGELGELEDVMITKEFRKWCKMLVEKAGVDKSESERVLSSDFVIDNVDGLYEFFAGALYEYLSAGNKWDMIPTEDFKGSLFIKTVDEKTTVGEAKNVQTGESLGDFKTTKKKHRELGVKSGCPDYLKTRTKC